MLKRPVALVLLLAAVVIAAFVGGYVAQQVRIPVDAGNLPPEGVPIPGAVPADPSSGAGSTGSGSPAGSAASAGTTGPRPLPPVAIPAQPPTTGAVPVPQAAAPGALPNTGVPSASSPAGPPTPKEVVVPAGTIVGIELGAPLSSETAKVEDPVEGSITKDVPVGPQIAIPARARVLGSVMLVKKGGRIKEPAQLGVRFHTLVLGTGPEVPLTIEPLIHTVEATAEKSKKTIGIGAAAGAALGWLLGGTEGAIKGGAAGAGGGTAATMLSKPKAAELPKGAQALVKLMAPITVTVWIEK